MDSKTCNAADAAATDAAANAITADDLAAARDTFFSSRANVVAKNATTSAGIRAAARVPEAVGANALDFDIDLKQGERTNQERSGRCWMFASLNTFRYRIIKKYNLSTFELSQAYPLFFDKLEKSNWFLANILDTLDEPLDGRLMAHLLADPIGDGGQWDMFKSLTRKYGVVPKGAMPETACSRNTREMDSYLTRYLRGAARRLRESAAAGVEKDDLLDMKREMMSEVYQLLVTCLGEPPARFDVRLHDKDGTLVLDGSFTPQEFFATAVDMELDDYVSLISAPTADKPFGRTFTVTRLGNVVEDGTVRYLNLEPAALKAAAIRQLRDGLPVWFGCDVAQSYLRDEGIMDTAALDVDGLFGFPVEGCMNKAERLDYGESLMTHAMVFEGVRLVDGAPTLWKVENSWGKDHGRDGFDTLSDAWFDEYVYQVVVEKKYLTEAERAQLAAEPIELAPWDPMGSLAVCRADDPAPAGENAGEKNVAVDVAWASLRAESFSADRANRVARNAVTSTNVMAAARDPHVLRTYHDTFGVSVPKTADITNQRSSGRCWLFSAYNVARHATMELLDVDTFEFSQAFGMFYDKLEKANAMLENVIATADQSYDDRAVAWVLDLGVDDGGYYPTAMDLIAKWGVVPSDAMPETACSKDSDQMNAQLERLVHRDAAILRKAAAAGATADELRAQKAQMLDGVHQVLATCLGEPPVTFDFECFVGEKCQATTGEVEAVVPAPAAAADKGDSDAAGAAADAAAPADKPADKKAGKRVLRDRGITPRQFAERYVPFDPSDYVVLSSMPGADRPWGTQWRMPLAEVVRGGLPNRSLNVPPEVLDQAAIASLRAGVPVAMACDVMQLFPRRIDDYKYVLSTDGVDTEGLFGVELAMDRADMLDMHETSLTHAMTFQGVQLDEKGNPLAWRVENSWGKDQGRDGYLIMSADWFHAYGGEVDVRREFVPEEWLRLWDEGPVTEAMPWSCVGAGLGGHGRQ